MSPTNFHPWALYFNDIFTQDLMTSLTTNNYNIFKQFNEKHLSITETEINIFLNDLFEALARDDEVVFSQHNCLYERLGMIIYQSIYQAFMDVTVALALEDMVPMKLPVFAQNMREFTYLLSGSTKMVLDSNQISKDINYDNTPVVFEEKVYYI